MQRGLSLHLDLVRFTAAFGVLLSHLSLPQLTHGFAWQLHRLGTPCVVLFFVLSGFVIAYVAETQEKTTTSFLASRFSRLWSVAIPALLLTIACDVLVHTVRPELFDDPNEYAASMPLLRVIAGLSFSSEIWGSRFLIFSNTPWWSLSYEFWFYLLFAAIQYASGARRLVLLVLGAAICGPYILAFFPLWWIGRELYRWRAALLLPRHAAWLAFLLPLAVLAILTARGAVLFPLRESITEAGYWRLLAGVYLAGSLFALHLVGAASLAPMLERSYARFARSIRWAGSLTFSLYMFHVPVMLAAAALIGWPDAWSQRLSVLMVPLLVVALIGPAIEARKGDLRRWLLTPFEAIRTRATLASTG